MVGDGGGIGFARCDRVVYWSSRARAVSPNSVDRSVVSFSPPPPLVFFHRRRRRHPRPIHLARATRYIASLCYYASSFRERAVKGWAEMKVSSLWKNKSKNQSLYIPISIFFSSYNTLPILYRQHFRHYEFSAVTLII